MIRVVVLLFFLSFLTNSIFGQVASDRPGQAFNAKILEMGNIQIQAGIGYFSFDPPSKSGNATQQNIYSRFGVLENFEIHNSFTIRQDEIKTEFAENNFGGLSQWNAGFRYGIYQGENFQPSFAILTDFIFDWVSEEYRPSSLGSSLTLLHSQSITEKFQLATNWGVTWNGNEASPTGSYVVNFSYAFTNNLGSFIETYGEYSSSDFDIKWDTGLSYLINNQIQLDIYGGHGKNDAASDWFIESGITWKIVR